MSFIMPSRFKDPKNTLSVIRSPNPVSPHLNASTSLDAPRFHFSIPTSSSLVPLNEPLSFAHACSTSSKPSIENIRPFLPDSSSYSGSSTFEHSDFDNTNFSFSSMATSVTSVASSFSYKPLEHQPFRYDYQPKDRDLNLVFGDEFDSLDHDVDEDCHSMSSPYALQWELEFPSPPKRRRVDEEENFCQVFPLTPPTKKPFVAATNPPSGMSPFQLEDSISQMDSCPNAPRRKSNKAQRLPLAVTPSSSQRFFMSLQEDSTLTIASTPNKHDDELKQHVFPTLSGLASAFEPRPKGLHAPVTCF